jgi:release factor glutamine methyltransferase
MTILESINLAAGYMEKKGVESARLNAELMLSHILGCKKLDLYLKFDKPLKENEVIKFREFLKRRGDQEPLQYIVGDVEFFGLTLKVDKNVLIPRPETELLVEEIINNTSKETAISILDIGTGSGNIAIALASNIPLSEVTTIDVSAEAICLAKKNAEDCGVSGRIKFVNSDILSCQLQFEDKFDIVVSNPPYVSKSEYAGLQPEIVKYEPAGAVTDGGDGYKFYEKIITYAKEFLKPGGLLYFEMGKGQSEKISALFNATGFNNVIVKQDYSHIDRIIYGVLS